MVLYQRNPTCLSGLLHELGHVLTGLSRHQRKFKHGWQSTHATAYPTSLVGKADLIHEEIEAWYRGYALAKRLGIAVDESQFWRDYGQSIVSYIRVLA